MFPLFPDVVIPLCGYFKPPRFVCPISTGMKCECVKATHTVGVCLCCFQNNSIAIETNSKVIRNSAASRDSHATFVVTLKEKCNLMFAWLLIAVEPRQ